MKVLVACVEEKEWEFRFDVGELNYSSSWPHFWMRCVIGDDWLQRINCDVSTPPFDVRYIEECAFVLYKSRQDAETFASWLPRAKAAVEEGYRTMRG